MAKIFLCVFFFKLDEALIGATFQQKWSELQKLLEKQRAKGGIIDPEVESNRFLIHINEVRGHQIFLNIYLSIYLSVTNLQEFFQSLLRIFLSFLYGVAVN